MLSIHPLFNLLILVFGVIGGFTLLLKPIFKTWLSWTFFTSSISISCSISNCSGESLISSFTSNLFCSSSESEAVDCRSLSIEESESYSISDCKSRSFILGNVKVSLLFRFSCKSRSFILGNVKVSILF